ncbi:hypothetical protein [Desulfobacter sp.]
MEVIGNIFIGKYQIDDEYTHHVYDESMAMADTPCQEEGFRKKPPLNSLTEMVEPAPSIKNSCVLKTVIKQTSITETAPINTDNKQILKETTTTCAREAEQVPEPVICDEVLSLSSSSSTNEIINLIPEQHQTPVVISLVSKAIVDYPEHEVKKAVAYAGANVRGGSMQFKAYLDKTLKNKWGEGFLDAMDNSNPFGQNLFGGGQFPSGLTTGSKRLDGNLADCLEDPITKYLMTTRWRYCSWAAYCG